MVCTCFWPSLVLHATSEDIQYRLSTNFTKNKMFMMHITRFILDTVWGTEPSTINNHMLEVKRNVIKCKDIWKALSYPSFCTYPVKDLLVMVPAADILMWSLEPETLVAFENFNTFSRYWWDFSTFRKDYINEMVDGASLSEYYRRKTILTKCSTQTIWFHRIVRR